MYRGVAHSGPVGTHNLNRRGILAIIAPGTVPLILFP